MCEGRRGGTAGGPASPSLPFSSGRGGSGSPGCGPGQAAGTGGERGRSRWRSPRPSAARGPGSARPRRRLPWGSGVPLPPPSHPAAPHSGEERATARGAGNKSYTETRCRFSPFNFASRNLHRSENITRFKQALLKSYRNVKNACGLKSLRHVIYPKSPKNGKRTFLRAKGDKFFRLLINWKESTGVFFFFFFLSKPCVAYGNSRTPTFVNAEVTLQTE